MASTTALLTGLTGLNANSRNLEVIGNNIANVNTTAFKGSRILFSTAMQRTLGIGSAPDENSGGTNPTQIGLGVQVGGTQRDSGQGSLQTTGDARDLAVDGQGYFVVGRGEDRLYTRAGSFRQDSEGNLATIDGDIVLGHAVDDEYNLVEGVLSELSIPLGSRALAQSTTVVRVVGNLNAAGSLPGGGSLLTLGATALAGFNVLATAANQPDAGNVLQTDSLLLDIEDLSAPGSSLFSAGQSLELSGARKGGAAVPTATLAIDGTTTVGQLMTFMEQSLGIHATGALNPDGATPGLSLDPTTGVLSVTGNVGASSDLEVENSALRLLNADGTVAGLPFYSSKSQEATGESVRTTFIAYDSLGQEVAIDITFALEEKTGTGTAWRYFLESADDTDVDLRLGTGRVDFDTSGILISDTPVTVTLDRLGTGAASPLTFAVDFSEDGQQLTSLADDPSAVASTFRDGRPSGTLEDFGIQRDGLITGIFSNGLTRTLGRVVLATFTNQDGLVEESSNLMREGPNSGAPAVVSPTTFGAGGLVSGALEQANVDLGQEFINMISASTGYSAASRVVSTADELLQQLVLLAR